MRTSTALGTIFALVVLATAGLFFEAWLLGIILSWFNVSLTIWQNLAIVFLANFICKSNVSSK